jgi:hypothetical protein
VFPAGGAFSAAASKATLPAGLTGGTDAQGGVAYTVTLTVRRVAVGAATVVSAPVETTVRIIAASAAESYLTTTTTTPPPLVVLDALTTAVPSAKRTEITADVVDGSRPFASFRWSATKGPDLDLRDPKIAPGGRDGNALALAPNALLPGKTYTLTLHVTDALGRTGVASVAITAAAEPKGGYLSATPAAGEAMTTPFRLEAPDWTGADAGAFPLVYRYTAEVTAFTPGGWSGRVLVAEGTRKVIEVGLYKFNPVDLTHSLKAPGFNP